jgi:competence protein ComEC
VWCGALFQSAVAPWRVSLAALLLCVLSIFSKKTRFVVLVFAILVGSTAMSLRQASIENSTIQKFFDSSVDFQAQVITDPSYSTSGNYSFLVRLLSFKDDRNEFFLRIPIRIITREKIELLPGQLINASARVIESKERRVAALFIVDQKIATITQPSRWASSLGAIRNGLRDHSGDGDAGSLIPGMVLGDTSKQTPVFKEQMKRSGLTHLVAVSGANFAIVSSFVLWLMQFPIKNKRYRLVATSIALICFIALVRPSPSVLRAAAMAAVLIFAQASNRAADSLPALGFAMAAVVIGDPWQARDAGFALSVLATAGLLLWAPIISQRLPVNRKFSGALAPPIAAMIFCSPVVVALSGYLSPMSIVANILAAPAVAPITIVGFIAALVAPFAPLISTLLIWFIRFPAGFIVNVAAYISDFPVLTIHIGAIGFSIVVAILALVWLFKKSWKKSSAVILVIVFSLTWIQRWPAGDWHIANCDVGQGDSMAINLGHGRAIVIDVGPDSQAQDKCLRDLGIKEIPLLILSHFHSDHVGGLSGLTASRDVGQVWISNNVEPILESQRALSLLNESKIVVAQKGMNAKISGVTLEVLWPEVNIQRFQTLPGDGSQINNSSIAMIISTIDWSIFTAGDLEPPAQHQLLGALRKVDIYKVSHHGSRYQDVELMSELSAQIAIISVGAKNSYGHPAPETIAALTRLGTQVVRTDLDGAIAITAKAHHLRVRKSKSAIGLFYWS